MMQTLAILYLLLTTNHLKIVFGDRVPYFSSFNLKGYGFGAETLIKDYVTLQNDPKASLPDSFTICSSLWVEVINSNSQVFEIYKKNGSNWFMLNLATYNRDFNKLSETLKLHYDNPMTEDQEADQENFRGIPIVPQSWYHICLGVDTVSGLLRIVVNGEKVVSEEREYFKNTTHWKPDSVAGRILVFKGFVGGFWYQFRNTFSNLNIFASMMSLEAMITRTAGGEECSSPGDYLRCLAEYEMIEADMCPQLGGDGMEHYWRGHSRGSGHKGTLSQVVKVAT